MADMIISTSHTPDTEQSPAGIEHGPGQATPPLAIEAAIAKNIADSASTVAPIDLDPNAPVLPGAPVEAIEAARPAGQPAAESAGEPVPDEEELDELIIEDFTIDGICGVY